MSNEPSGSRTEPRDPVEEAMPVEGTVIHREKVVSRALALISLAMFFFFGAASIAYLSGWQPETSTLVKGCNHAMVFLGLYVGLTRTVLRTVVSTHEIHVTQGLPGRRIPLEAITACKAFKAKKSFAGLPGLEAFKPGKNELPGELFSPGPMGVQVDWTDETGKARRTLIGSDDPERLLAIIERTRQARVPRLRVAGAPGAAVDEADEADEADAQPEAVEARKLTLGDRR